MRVPTARVTKADRLRTGFGWVAKSLSEDARWATWWLAVNSVGGSTLLPRVLRFALYRAAGMAIDSPNIFSGCTFLGGAPVSIGERTFVNRLCYFESVGPITIGDDCAIGMQVLFVTSTHPFDDSGRFSTEATGLPIRVGDRCWLGARSTILPGVTIGDDVVVAAGSVVTKDCEPAGLYAGVPARRIRSLPRGSSPGSSHTAGGEDAHRFVEQA